MTNTTSILVRVLGRAVLLVALVIASPAVAGAQTTPRYTAGPCPELPSIFPPVPENAECGTLTVLENRSLPGGRTIELSVAVLPAKAANPRPDPIVWLAGGPGDDGLTEIGIVVQGEMNRDRDVVFFSQRGTLTANPA